MVETNTHTHTHRETETERSREREEVVKVNIFALGLDFPSGGYINNAHYLSYVDCTSL